MRKIILASIILIGFTSVSSAGCYGSSSYYSCSDASGNNYTVNKSSRNTSMTGYNSRTGNNWSQNTTRSGNNSYTYGSDSRGRSWSSTTNSSGTFGTNANGNSFYLPRR